MFRPSERRRHGCASAIIFANLGAREMLWKTAQWFCGNILSMRTSYRNAIEPIMTQAKHLSETVREAMTIVRSLVRLYDNGDACKVALCAYEKAATQHNEAELEKWRSVLSGLLEVVQPNGNLRA
jgi:hypothetical protein